MTDTFICDGTRTPIGRFGGPLRTMRIGVGQEGIAIIFKRA